MAEVEPLSNDVVSSVLSFYSSELTSHASLIVGLIVGFFALVQARQSILGAGFPSWGFEFAVFAVVFGVVYSMFRLVLYGSLSGVLMSSSLGAYEEFLNTERVRLSDHALVNAFATYELVKYSRVRRLLYKQRGRYTKRANRRAAFVIQLPWLLSFVIASLITSMVFGASLEWLAVLCMLAGAIVLAEMMSIRLAIPSPWVASGS